jgi:predicted transcriptional regulator
LAAIPRAKSARNENAFFCPERSRTTQECKGIVFYVGNPVKAVDGYAEFIERKLGTPEEAWEKFGQESVLQSKKGYEEFVGNPTQVSFIRFQNLKTASNPVPLDTLRMLRGVKMLSRKGFYVDKNMAEKLISMME